MVLFILLVPFVVGQIEFSVTDDIVLEGSSVTVYCSSTSFSVNDSVTLSHNGTVLGVFPNMTSIDADGKKAFLLSAPPGLFLLITIDVATVSDSGLYTCSINQSNTAEFFLTVTIESLQCKSKVCGRQEYLIGEQIELTCDSLNSNVPGWFWNNSRLYPSQMMVYSSSSSVNVSLDSVHNSTNFDCFYIENQNMSESCSIGPIFVYDSYYISIEEGSQLNDSFTLTCRLIPEVKGVVYEWFIEPNITSMEISDSQVDSTLTIYDFSSPVEDTITYSISCAGILINDSFISGYNLTFVRISNGNNRFFITISVISGILLFVGAIVIAWSGWQILVKGYQRGSFGFSGTDGSHLQDSNPDIVLNAYEQDMVLTKLPDGRLQLQERLYSNDMKQSHAGDFINLSSTDELNGAPPTNPQGGQWRAE